MRFSNDGRRNTIVSTNSSLSSASTRIKSIWRRVSSVFSKTMDQHSSQSVSASLSTQSSMEETTVIASNSISASSSTVTSAENRRRHHHIRKKQWVERDSAISDITVPPFSPTYCKPNEFPYSNFYIKLPNGKWMVRYRSGNRDILATDQFEGYMI